MNEENYNEIEIEEEERVAEENAEHPTEYYKMNCELAYQAKRKLEKEYNMYREVTEQKLLFMQEGLNNLMRAIRLIGGNNGN